MTETTNIHGTDEGNLTEVLPVGVTYFIRAGDAIKIGFASNFKRRLGSLQTAQEKPLEVLAVISAGDVGELEAHQRFAHLRLSGEWFRADKELLQFIEYAKLKFGEAVEHKPAPKRKAAPAAPKQLTDVEKLRSLAIRHGHSTPIGSRYRLLAEMIERLPSYQRPAWATHEMQTLPYKINQTTAKLAELMAGAN